MSPPSLLPAALNQQGRCPQPEGTFRDSGMQAEAPPHRPRARACRPIRTRRIRGEHAEVAGFMDPMQPGPSNAPLTLTFPQDSPIFRSGLSQGGDEDQADSRYRALGLTSFLRPDFGTDERRWRPMKAIVAFWERISRGLLEVSSLAAKLASEPSPPLDDGEDSGHKLESYKRKPSSDPEQATAGQSVPQSTRSNHPFSPERWRDSTGEFAWDAERVMFVRDRIVSPSTGPIW
ncbi:hypothetical protein LTR70_001508 [Exophiala xenobiotica]|uniref:Uncharacterized protein n=1 Tax=Lithohypha guttulata TaxID=1690604 RepID=A0ABR0KH14_9EURO|nr:hypothetical protein LTR24_002798 [Lithohypha guttulata]KAK5327885.1 hypothetical protein LTR70_001508 [Exophiala xenobiotica]